MGQTLNFRVKLFEIHKNLLQWYVSKLNTSVCLNPRINWWYSVSRIHCWIARCRAFWMSPWNISKENILTTLSYGEWATRITHTRGNTICISTLLASGNGGSWPDAFTLRVGNTLDIGPLKGWCDCTWVSSDMLKYMFSKRRPSKYRMGHTL